MASFDIVETSGKAFIKAWEERSYLLRLAAVPVAAKIISFILVISLGLHENILRQTLFMLPAYMMEGWMLSHIVRLVFLGQRWPVQLSGEPSADALLISERARGVIGGLLVYTLLKMAQAALLAPAFFLEAPVKEAEIGESVAQASNLMTAQSLVAGVILMGLLIWGFRFLWLFIPTAANLPMKTYILALRGFSTSLYMIGGWLVCYIPFILFSAIFMQTVMSISPGDQGMTLFVSIIGHVAADSTAMIVVTLCMSYAIRGMMSGSGRNDK